MLTDHLARQVEEARSRKEKEAALNFLKMVRTATDEVIARATSDQVHQTH